ETKRGETLVRGVERRLEQMACSIVDYGLHATIVEVNDGILAELETMAAMGIPSFKMYMTYKDEGIMVSDQDMLSVFSRCSGLPLLPGVHAESDIIIESNMRKVTTRRWSDICRVRSETAEEDAALRAAHLAWNEGSALYVFHVSSARVARKLAELRTDGAKIYIETCPHYLVFDQGVLDHEDGHLYLMTPPLRSAQNREYLWRAVSAGVVDTTGSDDCTWYRWEKEKFLDRSKDSGMLVQRFDRVAFGVGGVEFRLPLLWTEGVERRGLPVAHLVELLSTRAAQVFGLFPRKGAIL
ncbi:MAG: amidohydrolase family protein, partial [Firmicutes bacterium]|nr:amidohydrolase family protein [Bacillota bacterium]